MKIYGKIIRDQEEQGIYGVVSPGTELYALGNFKGKNGRLIRNQIAGCAGKATQFLGGDYFYPKDTMSWGFDGPGSDLLAAWLIMKGLCSTVTMNESSCVYSEDLIDMEIMLRHYKQFSAEVIAKLPDEWEMDTKWVKGWVMEREKMEVKA